MESRKSSNTNKDHADNTNFFHSSRIGSTAAFVGTLNGMFVYHLLNRPIYNFNSRFALLYAVTTALATKLGVYGVRLDSICSGTNENLSGKKSQAKADASIAAKAAGVSTVAGWLAMDNFGDKYFWNKGFTKTKFRGSLGITAVAAGLAGYYIPILLNKDKRREWKANLKDKVRFLLFDKAPVVKNEEKKTITALLCKIKITPNAGLRSLWTMTRKSG